MSVSDLEAGIDLSTSDRWRALADEIRGLGSVIIEGQHRRKDGAIFPVEVSSTYIRLDRDYLVAVVRDVTERRSAEEALRQSRAESAAATAGLSASEERFRAFVAYGSEVISLMTPGGRVLYASPAVEQVLGYSPAEMLGMAGFALLDPRDRQPAQDLLARLSEQSGATGAIDLRIRHKDGDWRQIECTAANFLEHPNIRAIVLNYRDATEKSRALEQLRQQAALLDKAQAAIVVESLDGRVLFWNRGAEHLYGHLASDAIGKQAAEFRSDGPSTLTDARTRLLLDGEWVGELPGLTREGGQLIVHASWTLVRDDGGAPISILTIGTDISEKKALEEQLAHAQRIESLGLLASGVAHDFNNSLLAISGNVQLARSDLAADHPAQESLMEVEAAVRRAGAIVRRILTFSRKQAATRERVVLRSVVEEVLALLRASLPASISVRHRFEGLAIPVMAESTLVYQVVLNLCLNAAHAMRDRGGVLEVTVSSVRVEKPSVAMPLPPSPGDFLMINVRDEGIGMGPSLLGRIFDPFFTTKARDEGTGLGLSVVLGIMRNFGGAITVESEPDRGSLFSLYFPMSPVEVAAQPVVAKPRPLRRARILWVDDDESLLSLATRMLTRMGYEVTGFSRPGEALAAVESGTDLFDAVVSDLSMPLMDGPELVERMLRIRPDLAVLFVTSLLRPDDESKVSGLSAREIRLKPETIEQMQDLVDQLETASALPPRLPDRAA